MQSVTGGILCGVRCWRPVGGSTVKPPGLRAVPRLIWIQANSRLTVELLERARPCICWAIFARPVVSASEAVPGRVSAAAPGRKR